MRDLPTVLRDQNIDTGTLERLDGFGADAVHRLIVPGQDGVSLWHKLRSIVDETGHWPVILGDDDDIRLLKEIASHGRLEDSRAIIEAGESMKAVEWLAAERDYIGKLRATLADPDLPDYLKDSYRQTLKYLEEETPAAEPLPGPEQWPSGVAPGTEFISPYNLDGLIARLSVALVPVTAGWQVPAVLRFGDFNSCPPPHVHVCMLMHWNRTHGAELVAMTDDTIELLVTRPPTTREEALALGYDHSTYCGDTCEQFGLLPSQMPARLLGGSVWTFWWD